MASEHGSNTLFMVIVAIFLPPVAVGLRDGIGLMFVISILLWFLGVLPGIIFALWRVLM
jgi:uncharacterized membrane protein YqaE (UPF0057 family)